MVVTRLPLGGTGPGQPGNGLRADTSHMNCIFELIVSGETAVREEPSKDRVQVTKGKGGPS
jgi:hypothetical protein